MQQRVVFGASVGALLLGTTLTGCMVDKTYQPVDEGFVGDRFVDDDGFVVDEDDFDDDDFAVEGIFTGVSDGTMQGTVGPASGINQAPDRLTAYDDGWYLSVESIAQLEDRAAMLMLSASNAEDVFVAGTARTFRLDDYDAEGAQVTLLGCTGQNMDVFDEYDVPADEVEVVVEEGEAPGDVVVQIAGTWASQDYDDNGERIGEPKTASARFTLHQD